MPVYLLIGALRNLWHNKVHTLINLASLTLGLTVFSFAFLYVRQEVGYDRDWPNASRIHRMIVEQHGVPANQDGEFDSLNAKVFPPLMENYAGEIDKATRTFRTQVKPDFPEAKANQTYSLVMVEPNFVDIFKLDVVSGDMATVLSSPGFIAVEESVAANYPDKMKVGSRVMLDGTWFNIPGKPNGKLEYEVGAIYRLPKLRSSAVDFRMITLMHDYSLQLFPKDLKYGAWNDSVGIWLTFKPGVDIEKLHAGMPDYIDRVVTNFNQSLKAGDRISNHMSYRFQRATDMHFHPVGTEAFGAQRDQSQMLTVAAIGVLVLLVGCSNSISLSLAAVLERRRDIGIHKAVGALQNDILLQYLGEAVLLALLALVPALAMVHWLLPVFMTLLRYYQGALTVSATDFAVLGGIAMTVGLASGVYPALILSRVKPQLVLKSGNGAGRRGNQRMRTLLVGFQFCFAVLLMIGTLALFLQLQLLHKQPLGFSPHNLVYLNGQSRAQAQAGASPILDTLQKIPGITAVTPLGNPPNVNFPANINTVKYMNRGTEQVEIAVHVEALGADALSMLQIPLLAGRHFDYARDTKDAQTGRVVDQANDAKPEERIVLNRSAIKALGFANAQAAVDTYIFAHYSDRSGAVIETPTLIIGVMEDSFYNSLRRRPGPEGFRLMPISNFSIGILLKYEEAYASSIQQEITRVMKEVTQSDQVYARFLEEQLTAEFQVEKNQGKLLLYCAGLALFLSCIGLFGLASFTMQRGIKEVGIRKAMGATVSSLTALYLWRYAKPVLIATVIASPIAVYFVIQWLQRFPYQLELWWLLPLSLIAGGTVLVIALLTVAGIVIKTARGRPVASLRYE